jgi:hypothetical protein
MEERDASRIPEGPYCYTRVDGKRVNCPYWGRDLSRDEQESGFCTFLDIRDWDGHCVPLLWDGIKECGINNFHENWEA